MITLLSLNDLIGQSGKLSAFDATIIVDSIAEKCQTSQRVKNDLWWKLATCQNSKQDIFNRVVLIRADNVNTVKFQDFTSLDFKALKNAILK